MEYKNEERRLSTQINYTQTYFDEHSDKFSHDSINRLLKTEKVTPRMIWEQAQTQIVTCPEGFVIFDDTVLDKRHSFKIELVRRQWSGNDKRVIKGIGVVTCVYVNPLMLLKTVFFPIIYANNSEILI